MTMNATPQVSVRLNDAHLAMVEDIRDALATPLLPVVSLADAIRACITDTHGRLVTEAADRASKAVKA